MAKEKVIFTQNYEVQDDSGKRFERGEIAELESASAHHFVNRKAALPLDTPEGQEFKAKVDAEKEAAKKAARAKSGAGANSEQ